LSDSDGLGRCEDVHPQQKGDVPMKKRAIKSIVVVGLFFILIVAFIPTSRHPIGVYGGSPSIYSSLRQLYAAIVYLRGKGLDIIYPSLRELTIDYEKSERNNNLVTFLSLDQKFDDDIYACYVTESGYWFGYNLAPYYKGIFGYLYGIDDVGSFIREGLEGMRKKNSLYGSKDINTPPLSADLAYYYKASDDVIWLYLAK
jgi:hypothetical protein